MTLDEVMYEIRIQHYMFITYRNYAWRSTAHEPWQMALSDPIELTEEYFGVTRKKRLEIFSWCRIHLRNPYVPMVIGVL